MTSVNNRRRPNHEYTSQSYQIFVIELNCLFGLAVLLAEVSRRGTCVRFSKKRKNLFRLFLLRIVGTIRDSNPLCREYSVHHRFHLSHNKKKTSQKRNASPPKVSARNKRPRVDETPPKDIQEFTNEIKQMISAWKSDQDKTLSKLVSDVSDLKTQCNQIQKSNLEIEKAMEFISDKYEEMRNHIEELKKEREDDKQMISNLEKQIHGLQQKSRSATIEIRNISYSEKENTSDLTAVVIEVGKTINLTIQPSDLRDVFRVPSRPEKTGPIVAEFSSVQLKNNFLERTRNFNKSRQVGEKLNTQHVGRTGEKKPIYINEHLTPITRKLFYQSRQFAKQNGFNFCWSSNDKIYIRKDNDTKKYLIKSEQCLVDLLKHIA